MDMADERFRGNMHGLAKDAVVLSLDRAGTQARQSMLHASLAPPPQVRQRGRRILCNMKNMTYILNQVFTVKILFSLSFPSFPLFSFNNLKKFLAK